MTARKYARAARKRAIDEKANKFALESRRCFDKLHTFAVKHSDAESIDAFEDELCLVVDRYVDLNCEIYKWCEKNKIDINDFICDVLNRGTVSMKQE